MSLFTSLFWKTKSVDIICAKKSYMYNIKLVSVYEQYLFISVYF